MTNTVTSTMARVSHPAWKALTNGEQEAGKLTKSISRLNHISSNDEMNK